MAGRRRKTAPYSIGYWNWRWVSSFIGYCNSNRKLKIKETPILGYDWVKIGSDNKHCKSPLGRGLSTLVSSLYLCPFCDWKGHPRQGLVTEHYTLFAAGTFF